MENEEQAAVTFTFKCTEAESVNLKLRLKYDNLTQADFFRYLLKIYINKEPEMMNLVTKMKTRLSVMGQNKIRRTRREMQQGEDLLSELGITNAEKKNIFDLIEDNSKGDYD